MGTNPHSHYNPTHPTCLPGTPGLVTGVDGMSKILNFGREAEEENERDLRVGGKRLLPTAEFPTSREKARGGREENRTRRGGLLPLHAYLLEEGRECIITVLNKNVGREWRDDVVGEVG